MEGIKIMSKEFTYNDFLEQNLKYCDYLFITFRFFPADSADKKASERCEQSVQIFRAKLSHVKLK